MIQIKNLCRDWDEFSLKNIDLDIKQGEYFVILGPTGAGKTLLMEIMAGFHEPEDGEIWLDNRDVTKLPPEQRNVGFVYQDYALFPHMSVMENICFPMSIRGQHSQEEIEHRAHEVAELVGVSHLLHRSPLTLSGGEKQRTALARAIMAQPKVLLLDEPLSALDARTRDVMRDELLRIHSETGLTTIHVTHDQTEAMMLADRIAVMMDGRIIQVDQPQEVFHAPVDEEVAVFVGVENVIDGVIESTENGLAIISAPDGNKIEALSQHEAGDHVRVFIRPENIVLRREKDDSSARNNFKGTITRLIPTGPVTKVEVDCGFLLMAIITNQSADEMQLEHGGTIFTSFKATAAHVIGK